VYDEADAQQLWRLAESQAADDMALRTRNFSDSLYRLFRALATAAEPPTDDLGELQSMYAEAVSAGSMRLSTQGPQFRWPVPDLRTVAWAAAVSAFAILEHVSPSRIRLCPGPGRDGIRCGWLFVDATKNGSRRWCSMSDCGNTTKTRRQTERRRSGQAKRAADTSPRGVTAAGMPSVD
jgi:predicted RNA-binding Zn ribbon-like protein